MENPSKKLRNEYTIYDNGHQIWIKNGQIHREDGPACIYSNETQFWYRDGLMHRKDGPAYIAIDGYQEWWVNGKRTK